MSLLEKVKARFAKPYETVDVRRARELLEDGAVLVDVRSAAEYRSGHAPVAQHCELSQVPTRAARIVRNRPVVFVCHSGMRSASAARMFAPEAQAPVASLRGGMIAWERAGERVVRGGRR
ncbi:rhodanese-like domain-containing protein [Rhodococcus ruber]|uniref:rhodanese-like domain-containing protein n=1 Tax=Rhodococcus ruber TaxID=1830 RepID=UPI00065FB8E7|nr:rhodanese-like domain-containing protein [Rhodococcus ruber]